MEKRKQNMSRLVYVIIGLLALYCQSAFTSQYHTINTLNLKKVFDSVKPYGDLSSAYYSIKGLKLLGETITNAAVSKFQQHYIFKFFLIILHFFLRRYAHLSSQN